MDVPIDCDGVPDSDNDGWCDTIDPCPNTPGIRCCGDGDCASDEDCENCPEDCGECDPTPPPSTPPTTTTPPPNNDQCNPAKQKLLLEEAYKLKEKAEDIRHQAMKYSNLQNKSTLAALGWSALGVIANFVPGIGQAASIYCFDAAAGCAAVGFLADTAEDKLNEDAHSIELEVCGYCHEANGAVEDCDEKKVNCNQFCGG